MGTEDPTKEATKEAGKEAGVPGARAEPSSPLEPERDPQPSEAMPRNLDRGFAILGWVLSYGISMSMLK